MSQIKIVALIGRAGAGKNACLDQVCKVIPTTIHRIVPVTTRPPRQGEINGKDYCFIWEEEFDELNLLESTSFKSWHYGTPLESLDPNKVNIGVFNPKSLEDLMISEKNGLINFIVVEVWAAPKTRLLRQLNREKDPDCNEIVRRFQADQDDFSFLKLYPIKEYKGESYIKLENDYLDIAETCTPLVRTIQGFAQAQNE